MKKRLLDFYMNVARECAKLSRAKRLQVGSIIVKNDNIVSFSWNGTPSGWDNDCEHKIYLKDDKKNWHGVDNLCEQYPYMNKDGENYRLETKPEVLHAEMNALMKLTQSTESGRGAILFVTHAPCIECAKGIHQAGIKEVYYEKVYRNADGLKFLERSGIPTTQLNY
jgi:dCMP deaminase